jgi:hypothetical protein
MEYVIIVTRRRFGFFTWVWKHQDEPEWHLPRRSVFGCMQAANRQNEREKAWKARRFERSIDDRTGIDPGTNATVA